MRSRFTLGKALLITALTIVPSAGAAYASTPSTAPIPVVPNSSSVFPSNLPTSCTRSIDHPIAHHIEDDSVVVDASGSPVTMITAVAMCPHNDPAVRAFFAHGSQPGTFFAKHDTTTTAPAAPCGDNGYRQRDTRVRGFLASRPRYTGGNVRPLAIAPGASFKDYRPLDCNAGQRGYVQTYVTAGYGTIEFTKTYNGRQIIYVATDSSCGSSSCNGVAVSYPPTFQDRVLKATLYWTSAAAITYVACQNF